MSISLIPFWLPLLCALIVTFYWRVKMKEPINHWAVCALIFAINVFWFAYAFVAFLTIMAVHFLKKKEDKSEDKKEDGTTK